MAVRIWFYLHQEAQLSEENSAHPDDFYFTLHDTPHIISLDNTQSVGIYVSIRIRPTILLIANKNNNIQSHSPHLINRLHDDIQIVGLPITLHPYLRHDR